MEKIQKKQKEVLGIEKLLTNLEQAGNETKRMSRDQVIKLFNQIIHEIPYASEVISPALAENLMSDASQLANNLQLNETILLLAKALFNPAKKDDLATLTQNYRHNRIKTEKEYALSLIEPVLTATNLASFPTNVQPSLKVLAQDILEIVISEKQLRRVPGYRLRPLIDIVESFLYKKSLHSEMENIKNTQTLNFKKFINAVAQAGYEQINDDKKLIAIRKENEEAFNVFKTALTNYTSTISQLKKFQEIFQILQNDQKKKFYDLGKFLQPLFQAMHEKPHSAFLIHHLQIRIHEKLRKTFRVVNLDAHIYSHEETMKAIHEDVLNEVKDDANAIINLVLTVLSIHENYNKKMLHKFSSKKNLALIDELLITALLGKNTPKIDPLTAKTHFIRIGGYPQKPILDIYKQLINQFQTIQEQLSGLFVKNLKEEIDRVMSLLDSYSKNLKVVTRAPIVKQVEEIPIFSKEQSEAQLKALVEAELKKATQENTTIVNEVPTELPLPSSLDEQFDIEPEPIVPQKKEEVIIPAPITEEKIEPKPLIIDEQFDIEEPIVLEKVTSNAPLPEPESESDPALQALLETGTNIMKNYQLGDFEQPIAAAWKKMITAPPTETQTETNDVRLYVICDLAQQVSNIAIDHLPAEQQQAIQSIHSQLLSALDNPLDENNWDYFEGSKRDFIDGVLMSLS